MRRSPSRSIGRAAAGADGIEQVHQSPHDRRGHGNCRGIEIGKGGANAARARDHARDAEADVVGPLVADDLQRHAGHCRALDGGRAVLFSSLRESVVRKPPIAGPKPTQAISTSMRGRPAGCSVVLNPSSPRIIQRFGNHDLRQCFGGAVFGQLRAGEAAIELGAEALERFQSRCRKRRARL